MEQATQSTAAAAEEGAAGAAELKVESVRLKEVVQELYSMVSGGSAASSIAPLPRRVPTSSAKPFVSSASAGTARIVPAPSKRIAIVTSVKGPVAVSEIEEKIETIRTADARQSFPLEEDFKDF